MAQLQIFNSTSEEVTKEVIAGVNSLFEKFVKDFQPKTPTELLTRNEVAEWLKIDLSTLWAWTNKGKVKAYGIGNRVYYKRSEIEEILKPLNS